MACDLCDSCDDRTGSDREPTGGKYCGHQESCDCSDPKPPKPPSCDNDDGGPGSGCDPDDKIRKLQEVLETSKAAATEAETTLAELTRLGNEYKAAIQSFSTDAENREKRRSECCEFIKCKEPHVPDTAKACVDEQIKKVCAYLHALEERARFLNWAWGKAEQKVRWEQWEYDRLLHEYNTVKALATQCHAQCEEARKKYDAASKAGDKKLQYLYWKIAKELAERAKDCCGDYEAKLCEAFEALSAASERLGDAKRKSKQLSAELTTVKKQVEEYRTRDSLWSRIAHLVTMCCECPTDSDDSQSKSSEQSC